jgi:hypothetical protein
MARIVWPQFDATNINKTITRCIWVYIQEGQHATPPKFPSEVQVELEGQQVPPRLAHCDVSAGQAPSKPPPKAHPPTNVVRWMRPLDDSTFLAGIYSPETPAAETESVRIARVGVENIISIVLESG